MSAQKGRPLTPAQRQARQRNGQKSTGPQTPMGKKIVSLNAVKHGMYSCPAIRTLAVLGENPIEYLKLLTGLINSFHSRNPAEMTMLNEESEEVQAGPAPLPEEGGKVGLRRKHSKKRILFFGNKSTGLC